VRLTGQQRRFIESVVPEVCDRGGWGYHIAAAGSDHVHVLLSADTEGKVARRLLKRWLGQALSLRWPLSDGQSWWAEGGSVKWVWDEAYFRRSFDYIANQRATEWRA
jgi:REP element-mobilizing transposase RayT